MCRYQGLIIFCTFCNDSFHMFQSLCGRSLITRCVWISFGTVLSPFVWTHTRVHSWLYSGPAGTWQLGRDVCVCGILPGAVITHSSCCRPGWWLTGVIREWGGGGLVGRKPCPGLSQTCPINLITLPHTQMAAAFSAWLSVTVELREINYPPCCTGDEWND